MLNICLFGRVRISRDPEELRARESQATTVVKLGHFAQGLIAYLALNGHKPHSRDNLSELFWGDQPTDQSKACLSTALWRLRRVLEPAGVARGTYLLDEGNGDISLNPRNVTWLDVTEFEDALKHLSAKSHTDWQHTDVERAELALCLCQSALMEDFYSDWVLAERERLRCLKLNGMTRLLAFYRDRGMFDRAIEHAQNILRDDPLREDIHRELMRLYRDTGRRALAAKQYEACRVILQSELGIRPMLETQQVMAELAADQPHVTGKSPGVGQVGRVNAAILAVQAAQVQLQQAMHLLGQVIGQSDRL